MNPPRHSVVISPVNSKYHSIWDAEEGLYRGYPSDTKGYFVQQYLSKRAAELMCEYYDENPAYAKNFLKPPVVTD